MNKNISILTIIFFVVLISLQINLYPQEERPEKIKRNPEKTRENDDNNLKEKDVKRIIVDETSTERKKTIERPTRENTNPTFVPRPEDKTNNQPVKHISRPIETIVEIQTVQEICCEEIPISEPVYYPKKTVEKFSFRYYWDELDRLDEEINKYPYNYKLFYYRGIIEIELGFYREAKRDFTFYSDYFFYESDGYFQRGLVKLYLNDLEGAKKDFLIAADLGERRALLLLNNLKD